MGRTLTQQRGLVVEGLSLRETHVGLKGEP